VISQKKGRGKKSSPPGSCEGEKRRPKNSKGKDRHHLEAEWSSAAEKIVLLQQRRKEIALYDQEKKREEKISVNLIRGKRGNHIKKKHG